MMRNDLTPFRTVRELLVNRDEVLMSNAIDTEGKLYADSVENLTAILAMQDSYNEMLAALEAAYRHFLQHLERDWFDDDDHDAMQKMFDAITKAKGAAA
jgi:hypothetical protein